MILAEPMHVYDVKAGKYLGKVKEIEISGRSDMQSAELFALQKERIKDVVLVMDKAVERGKAISIACQVRAEGALSCEGRVVRIELRGPDGKQRSWYRRMAYLNKEGCGNVTVKLALNDPPGSWETDATDIASGIATQTGFVLH